MSNKTIIKKSSEIEEFSENKLRKSIINAFKSVSMGYSKKLIDNIISQLDIEDKTSSNDIRNQLEVILMNNGYYNVAKAFIAYEQKKLVQNRDVADRYSQSLQGKKRANVGFSRPRNFHDGVRDYREECAHGRVARRSSPISAAKRERLHGAGRGHEGVAVRRGKGVRKTQRNEDFLSGYAGVAVTIVFSPVI